MKYLIDLRKARDGLFVSAEVELDEDLPVLSPEAMKEVQALGSYLVDAAKAWVTMSPEDRLAYQRKQLFCHTTH
jgi:hypothetical protein